MPPRKTPGTTAKSNKKASDSTSRPKGKASSKPKATAALSAEALGIFVKNNPQLIQQLLASHEDALDEAAQEQRRTAHKRCQPPPDCNKDDDEEADGYGDEGEGEGEHDGNGSSVEDRGSDGEYEDQIQDDVEDIEDDEDELQDAVEDSPLRNKQSRKRAAAAPHSGERTVKRRRKSNVNADPAVSIGKSVTLLHPLARPRNEKTTGARPTPAQTALTGTPPSTPRGSCAAESAIGSDAAPRAAAATSDVPCTPYVRRPNPKKAARVLESQLTSPTKKILVAFKDSYRVYIATENGFPSLEQTVSFVKARLPDALQAGRKKARIARATDKTYENDLAVLLYGKASDIRNHLVAVAKSVVPEYYKLDTFKNKGLRKKEVRRLTAKCAFVHSDTTKIEGLFEHPAIRAVIQRAFFTSSKPAFNVARFEDYKTRFDPFPRPLLALAGAALWCALDQWSTGAFVQVNFDGDVYKPRYQKLLDKIAELVDDEPDLLDYFNVLCSGWYAEASEAAGIFGSDSDNDDDSEDDADITARNQAALRAAARAARAARAAQDGVSDNAGAGTAPDAGAS